MTYVFADEAGNFDFSRGRGASRYFILTSLTIESCCVGDDLIALRRSLAWERFDLLSQGFHATEDRQAVRNRVFELLVDHDFQVDATILDKPKTFEKVRKDEAYFYQLAWFLHLKHVVRDMNANHGLLVIAATLGTKAKRQAAHSAVRGAVRQVAPTTHHQTVCWDAGTDPCLQVADYCCWAIQRKWEKGDPRSYDLIKDKIRSEFDVFAHNDRSYY